VPHQLVVPPHLAKCVHREDANHRLR
jgi:hypothetical protein